MSCICSKNRLDESYFVSWHLVVKCLNDFWPCSNQQVASVLLCVMFTNSYSILIIIDVSFVTMFLVTIITDFAFVFSNL